MIKELHESGELIYTEEDLEALDSDEDDEETDSDDSDAGGPSEDADDDHGGDSEIDDGLNDPDSFPIHTESERSADEDDDLDHEANDEDVAMEEAESENLESASTSVPQDHDEAYDADDEDADNYDSEPSNANGDSDPGSDESDDESGEDIRAPILKLSNELLTKIVLSLDPPTAVCLGLSCKQHYKMVPAACKTTFRKICPRFADESSGSPLLPPYYPTPEEILVQRYASTAIKLIDAVRDYDKPRPKCLLSTDYIALMNRLAGYDILFNPNNLNYCSVNDGHMTDSPGAVDNCGVCTVMQLMQAFRVYSNHGVGEGPSDYEFNYVEDRAQIDWRGFR